MRTDFFPTQVKHLAFVAAVAIVGAAIANAPAAAQSVSGTTTVTDEITVTAPYTVRRHVEGRSAAGIPIETLSVARHIYYGDLNLARHADAVEFQQRIEMAAKDACDQLNKLYPEALYTPVPGDQNCVQTATNEAMGRYNTIVASAGNMPTYSQTTTTTTTTVDADVASAQRAADRAARSAAEAMDAAKAAQQAANQAGVNASEMSGSSMRNK